MSRQEATECTVDEGGASIPKAETLANKASEPIVMRRTLIVIKIMLNCLDILEITDSKSRKERYVSIIRARLLHKIMHTPADRRSQIDDAQDDDSFK